MALVLKIYEDLKPRPLTQDEILRQQRPSLYEVSWRSRCAAAASEVRVGPIVPSSQRLVCDGCVPDTPPPLLNAFLCLLQVEDIKLDLREVAKRATEQQAAAAEAAAEAARQPPAQQ